MPGCINLTSVVVARAGQAEGSTGCDTNDSLGSGKVKVWDAMVRTWEVVPKCERIAKDVGRWELALGMIVQYGGAIVPDMDNRHGRREACCVLCAVRFVLVPHPLTASRRTRHAKWEEMASRMAEEP